jgi:hypothetical protein
VPIPPRMGAFGGSRGEILGRGHFVPRGLRAARSCGSDRAVERLFRGRPSRKARDQRRAVRRNPPEQPERRRSDRNSVARPCSTTSSSAANA